MRAIRVSSAALIAVVVIAADPAAAQPAGANYDEATVPAYTLPDPLRFVDGVPVGDPGAWTSRRRAEILRLFEEHVYGRSPGPPTGMRFAVVETDPRALGGLATRRQVRVLLDGTEAGPAFEILLYVPNAAPRPVPAFLGLNFGGNHSVHPDPGIRLSTACSIRASPWICMAMNWCWVSSRTRSGPLWTGPRISRPLERRLPPY